jgi:hypothetical protein
VCRRVRIEPICERIDPGHICDLRVLGEGWHVGDARNLHLPKSRRSARQVRYPLLRLDLEVLSQPDGRPIQQSETATGKDMLNSMASAFRAAPLSTFLVRYFLVVQKRHAYVIEHPDCLADLGVLVEPTEQQDRLGQRAGENGCPEWVSAISGSAGAPKKMACSRDEGQDRESKRAKTSFHPEIVILTRKFKKPFTALPSGSAVLGVPEVQVSGRGRPPIKASCLRRPEVVPTSARRAMSSSSTRSKARRSMAAERN